MTPLKWTDIRPGVTITVKHIHRVRPFKLRVTAVRPVTEGSQNAFIVGERLRMDGTRSSLPSNWERGLRRELVHLDDVVAVEPDPRRKHNADGRRVRGTSNGNARGGSKERRVRKLWLLGQFGDGTKAPCSFECGEVLTLETITVDRFPLPGCQGGTYARGNIRPACSSCNSARGAVLRRNRVLQSA